MLTHARDFVNILEKVVLPYFQNNYNYSYSLEHSRKADKFLINVLNYAYQSLTLQYKFTVTNYTNKKGYSEFIDSSDILNSYYRFIERDILVVFQKDFSRHFFKENKKYWKRFKNDISQLIQHEKVHASDYFNFTDEEIKNKDFGTVIDIGHLSEHPNRRIRNTYNDVVNFCLELKKLNISIIDFNNNLQNELEEANNLVKRNFKKYKKEDRFIEFKEIFYEYAYANDLHTIDASERRALTQEIIIEFFRSGLNKADIIKVIQSDTKETASETYNNLISVYGFESLTLQSYRYRIGKRLVEEFKYNEASAVNYYSKDNVYNDNENIPFTVFYKNNEAVISYLKEFKYELLTELSILLYLLLGFLGAYKINFFPTIVFIFSLILIYIELKKYFPITYSKPVKK